MMPLPEKQLSERDAKRDIGAELLKAVLEMKTGKGCVVARVAVSPVIEARTKSGLSQAQFAQILGVSVRTLRDWEQGRRQPSGAAKTLLAIAGKRPEVLRDAMADSRMTLQPTL